MKRANYILFSSDNKYFIFDYFNIIYGEIDENLYTIFNKILENGNEIDCIEKDKKMNDVIKKFYDQDLFFSDREVVKYDSYNEAFLSMPSIHACNMKCKYCFAQSGENYDGNKRDMDRKTIKDSLDYLYFEYFKECHSFRFDFVSGGEPLLNVEAIKNIIYVTDEYRKSNKNTQFWLCTNGTIKSDNIFSMLNSNRFNIGISLDGEKNYNDSFRIYKNGQGTYDNVIKTIESVISNNSYTRNFKNVWGLVVVTAKTPSLVTILKHHSLLGFQKVQMRVVRTRENYGLNKDSLEIFKKLYNELFQFFLSEFENGSTFYMEMILNDNDYLGKMMRRIMLRTVVANRCQAGKNKVSLAANGDLYPCDAFVGNNEYCIGNALRKELYSNRFKELFTSDIPKCNKCWARYICGGDCYHNSVLMCGSIMDVDSSFCDMQKYMLENIILLFCNMNEKNEDMFERLARKTKIGTREGLK